MGIVHSLLASTLVPSVVNFVRLTLSFERQLPAGLVGHVTIVAPVTTKVLCQQFSDISGGGSVLAMLPLDPDIGAYGTHDCMLQNTITLHLNTNKPLLPQNYILQIGVLNPGDRAVKDYWSVELLPSSVTTPSTNGIAANGNSSAATLSGQVSRLSNATVDTAAVDNFSSISTGLSSDWRTAEPMLRIRVRGFGVSEAFTGPAMQAVALGGTSRRLGAITTPALLAFL